MDTLVFVDSQSVVFDFSNKEKTIFLKPLGKYTLCLSYFTYLELLARGFNSNTDLSLTLVKLFNKGFSFSSTEGYPNIDKIIDDVLSCKMSMSEFNDLVIHSLNTLKFEYVVARCVVEHFLYYLVEQSKGHLPDDKSINLIIDDYNNSQYERIIELLNLHTFKDEDINEILVNKSRHIKSIMKVNSFKKELRKFFEGIEEVQFVNLINIFCKRNHNILKPFKGLNSMGTILGFDMYFQIFEYIKNGKTLEPKINNIIDFYNLCLISEKSYLLTRDTMARHIINQLADNLQKPFILTNKKINDIFVRKLEEKENISRIY